MLRTDLLLLQQLFSVSIYHPLYQAWPTWPAAATLLRLDANLFGITLLVQKLPRWYHQHIVTFCELSFDPSNFNCFLSGYKLWGEYLPPGLFLSCLPLLLERYLRVIGRSFTKLGNGTLKIGPLSCRQVGSVLRWLRKTHWTRFSRSSPSPCPFPEDRHFSISSDASTKAGWWWALIFLRSGILSASFHCIRETTKKFPTRMDSMLWSLAIVILEAMFGWRTIFYCRWLRHLDVDSSRQRNGTRRLRRGRGLD